MTDPTPASASRSPAGLIAYVKTHHVETLAGVCAECCHVYPCDAAALLDLAESLVRERDDWAESASSAVAATVRVIEQLERSEACVAALEGAVKARIARCMDCKGTGRRRPRLFDDDVFIRLGPEQDCHYCADLRDALAATREAPTREAKEES